MATSLLATIINSKYDKTPAILIGNGINRITNNNLSWEDILDELIMVGNKQTRKGNKPLTFLFEEILHSMEGGATRGNEQKLKEAAGKALDSLIHNELHEKFMGLKMEHFFTTNYDYCLERAADPLFKKTKAKKKEGESKKHSLCRYNRVNNKFVWHIHGEVDNGLIDEKNNYPEKSVMFGFDQYMRTLMDMSALLNDGSYINQKIKHPEKNTLEETFSNLVNTEIINRSWVSFFFTHDIHIIGLDLGVHETDLWWLLHYRRKLADRKMLAYKNTLTFYVPSYELLHKRDQLELLQSLGVNLVEVQCAYNKGNFYREFYENAYELIRLLL